MGENGLKRGQNWTKGPKGPFAAKIWIAFGVIDSVLAILTHFEPFWAYLRHFEPFCASTGTVLARVQLERTPKRVKMPSA